MPPFRFLSTLSLRRATCGCFYGDLAQFRISIHALLAESDRLHSHQRLCQHHFYPRSPCGERRAEARIRKQILDISIHALLAESDSNFRLPEGWNYISIHALLAESDRANQQAAFMQQLFLSTLSLRRATLYIRYALAHIKFLSTLSLRRATAEQ